MEASRLCARSTYRSRRQPLKCFAFCSRAEAFGHQGNTMLEDNSGFQLQGVLHAACSHLCSHI